MICLICTMHPITRSDADGLCLSCRFAVADGLYQVQPANGRRLIRFATSTEHVLGCEWPNWSEPIEYRPELLPKMWREIDAAAAVLESLESHGGYHAHEHDTRTVAAGDTGLGSAFSEHGTRAPLVAQSRQH